MMRLTRGGWLSCNGAGGARIMMGFKERAFAPLVAVSLEELVPQDHFYRYLHKILDLSFVYNLVRESYSVAGRPSIDPVVFFKLQLIMFFEDIRSERLLMRQVADRLSVRWYLGYDFGEPLPDHSSLTRIRTRYGIDVFRRFAREDCRTMPTRWTGLGERILCRCNQGSSPRSIRLPETALCRGSPSRQPVLF